VHPAVALALGLLAETLKHLGEQVLLHAMHHLLLDWICTFSRYTCVISCAKFVGLQLAMSPSGGRLPPIKMPTIQ
jgi:hypothetical protein